MDERLLILDAIKQKDTNTPINLDVELSEPDAIEKWVKRKRRQESFRQKECEDWNNADFLRYLDFMLKEFGVVRSKGNLRVDANRLNHVYDALAIYLQHKMNNMVLKSYLDWWCSIWAPRLTGSEMYLNSLLRDYQIKRFASRYAEKESEEQILPIPAQSISDEYVYDLGGLDLLVMKRGIVVGYRMLRERAISDPSHVLRNTLASLTKDALLGVMNTTIQHAPYSRDDKIDFIALAKPFLQNHGLTDFLQILHEKHFRSD